jgi:hypothetical protein
MKRLAIIAAVALAAGAGAWLGAARPKTFLLTGEVADAGNGMAVYGAQVRFGDRSTRLFTAKEFRLTLPDRSPGTLEVQAPGYRDESREVTPRGRVTRVTVALQGREVAGLAGILVWGEWEGDTLRLDIRLTGRDGTTIEHVPVLPFRGEVRIAENRGSTDRPVRGTILFEGQPPLTFDPSSRLEKLKCRIGAREMGRPGEGIDTGVLDFTLYTGQGEFSWSRADLPLRPGQRTEGGS